MSFEEDGMGRRVVRSNDSVGDRRKMSSCEAGEGSFQTCYLTEIYKCALG